MSEQGFNELTPSREGKQMREPGEKNEVSAWIRKHNLDAQIVSRLQNEEMHDIKTLRDFPMDQLATLRLNPGQTDLLRTALEQLRLGDVNEDCELRKFCVQYGVTLETVQKLKDGGKDNLEKLKHTTQDDMIQLHITGGQRVKVSRAIGNLPVGAKLGTGLTNMHEYLKSWKEGIKLEDVDKINDLNILKVPVEETYTDDKGDIRKCVIGNCTPNKPEKTIMIVGATGSGKSTLVDGMFNYIIGTEWEDNERFKLINEHSSEAENASKGQAMSQTEWITIYSIYSSKSTKLDYTLNIIDTPGFGDTRGITRDERLVQQISSLFKTRGKHEIDEIDAVCFVAKSPDARLTASQRYIFDSVTSIFGKNIKDNILVMVTFADGAAPPVLNAIKASELPFTKEFIFNNSALHEGKGNEWGKMFWKMGIDNFKTFFEFLDELRKQSLSLSNAVLEQRQNLKENLAYLQERVVQGVTNMAELVKEKESLKQNEICIKENKNFTYQMKKYTAVKKTCPPGRNVTHCMKCHETCHSNCKFRDDETKAKCCAMDKKTGKCIRCKLKCHWKEHRNVGYYIEQKTEVVEQRYESKYKNYVQAQEEADKTKKAIDQISKKYTACEDEVKEYVVRCRDIMDHLREIAMKKEPVTEFGYIEELIKTETNEQRPGWNERVQQLTQMKSSFKMLEYIKHKKNLMQNC